MFYFCSFMLRQLNNPQKTPIGSNTTFSLCSIGQFKVMKKLIKDQKHVIGIGRNQLLLTVNIDPDEKFDQLPIIMERKIRII